MKLQYVGPISPIFVPAHNEYLDIETGDVVEFTDTLGGSLLESANWEKPGTAAAKAALEAVAAGPQSYEDALAEAKEQVAESAAVLATEAPEVKPKKRAPAKRAAKKAAPVTPDPDPEPAPAGE